MEPEKGPSRSQGALYAINMASYKNDIDQASERNFPTRLLYIAMEAYFSERILRAGETVEQSNTALHWHTGWLLLGK